VTWWRGDNILPLKDDKVEIGRDYLLTINRVEIVDLGPYKCQAYNSIGRPASIQVTLKVRGQLHARTEEERKYLQYVEHEPYEPPQTYRPPTHTPTQPPTQLQRTPALYNPPQLPPDTAQRQSFGEFM
jgi:papilin